MSSYDVQDQIWKHLAANWHETPIVDVDNTLDMGDYTEYERVINVVPSDSCAWITPQFYYAPEEQASLGNPGRNWWREDGEFLIYIYVPTGSGTGLIKRYGEALQHLFRGEAMPEGIQITGVSAPAPREEQPIQEGRWYAPALTITYYCYKVEEPYYGVPN